MKKEDYVKKYFQKQEKMKSRYGLMEEIARIDKRKNEEE